MKAMRCVCFLSAIVFVGCSTSPRSELSRLRKVDSFELYSLEPFIDPNNTEADYDPKGSGERLHGWRVLGKTTVSDEATRREVIDALDKGIDPEGRGAKCFWPRHAIRRMSDDKPVDLLICFQCGNIEIYRNGKRVGSYSSVSRDVQSTLDEVLRKADIPLAKKPKD